MKKFFSILVLLSFFDSTNAQTINCTNFCVLGMTLDTVQDELLVTIANGDTNSVNYPTVVVTDANGDTVGNINNTFYLFAQPAGDTITHVIPSTLTSLPSGFTGTVYFTDQVWDITCSFSFPMNCTVGLNEYATTQPFSVYPNPAADHFTVRFNSEQQHNALISILDVTGKTIRTYSASNSYLTINRDGLQSGLYFISVIIDGKRSTNKLVIK